MGFRIRSLNTVTFAEKMKWFLLALGASLVAAGDGDDDDYEVKTPTIHPPPGHKPEEHTETKVHKKTEYHKITETVKEPEYHKVTETVKVPEYHAVTDTVKVPEPYGVTETVKIPEPYAVTDTEYQDVPTTIYQDVPTTLYHDIPTTVVQDVPTTIYLTDTLTRTEVSTPPQCEFCKIDIYATPLVFPTSYAFTTVYETTYDVYKTVYDDLNSTVYSTSTIFAPTTCIEPLVTTWERFGVVLTSPTTYLAYTNFSRGFLEPRPTVYGCGELVSVPLELGTAATSFEELIIETTVIPTTPTEAPLQLLEYLDTIPTVVAQLSGVPAFSCDLPTISGVATTEPQVTAVAATTVAGATLRKQKAQHVLGALASSVAATATSMA